MTLTKSVRPVWIGMLALSIATSIACNKADKVAASSDGGKVPITTTSDEARKEFLTGRDLSERLLGQEAVQHFDKRSGAGSGICFGGIGTGEYFPDGQGILRAPEEGGGAGAEELERRKAAHHGEPGGRKRSHGNSEGVSGSTGDGISE